MAYQICKKNRKKNGYKETEIVALHTRNCVSGFLVLDLYVELDI